MKIDIAHIAKLSRLHIEPEKMDKFEKDMAAIVDMVDRLPDVEDELTLDAAHPMKLREDVPPGRDAGKRTGSTVRLSCRSENGRIRRKYTNEAV
jgi:aspartyl/glutamyl-tRNA(Asn/Gln) amidotransferase C subunit